jgi:uncharacterized protein YggT (Ycf19 family)
MEPDKLAADEARRVAQHERIKSELEGDVHARIAREARASQGDRAEVGAVAQNLKHRAAAEVAESEDELQRARGLARVSQVVDYVFYVLYGRVGLEIVLELFGARQSSGFKRALDTLTAPALLPFKGLMPDPSVGSLQLMVSFIVALGVYMLLHLAINGALRLFVVRKAAI